MEANIRRTILLLVSVLVINELRLATCYRLAEVSEFRQRISRLSSNCESLTLFCRMSETLDNVECTLDHRKNTSHPVKLAFEGKGLTISTGQNEIRYRQISEDEVIPECQRASEQSHAEESQTQSSRLQARFELSQSTKKEKRRRPPTFIKSPPNNRLLFKVAKNEDDPSRPFSLECEAEGIPTPSYTWYKQGQPYSWNDSRISQQPNRGTLVFAAPGDDDEGDYFCMASNQYGTSVSNTVQVRIASLESFPESPVQLLVVNEGDPLTLPCLAPAGFPEPSITWVIQTPEGALRSINNSRITVDSDGALHFSPVIKEDGQDDNLYACMATNKFLVEYKLGNKIRLNVVSGKKTKSKTRRAPVEMFKSQSQLTSEKGKSLDIHCIYEGHPEPHVTWKKNGENINASRVSTQNFGKTLRIENAQLKDEGTYECTVSNGIGSELKNPVQVTIYDAPYWVNVSENADVAEGGDVSFECRAGGFPQPVIEWFRNGVPIEADSVNDRRILVQDHIVVIQNVRRVDTAVFQCRASNVVGQLVHNVYLNVQGLLIEIQEHPAERNEAVIGSAVNLTCRAIGDPRPTVHWHKNGKEFVGPRFTVLPNGDLQISNVTSKDAGQYKCVAVNKFGRTQSGDSVGFLDVKEKTRIKSPPVDIKKGPDPPKLVGVECSNTEAILQWQPPLSQDPQVLGYIIQYNTTFKPHIWIAYDEIPAGETQFRVPLSPWANYTFRVLTRYDFGESSPSEVSKTCSTPSSVPFKNPDNVHGQGTEPGNLVISWTPMKRIQHNAPGFYYRVFYREDVKGGAFKVVDVFDWTTSSITIPNIPLDTSYQIKVVARNSLGEAHVASPLVIGYSWEDIPLESPKNFVLSQIIDGRTALFQWNSVEQSSIRGHFKGYKFEAWTDDNVENPRTTVFGPSVTSGVVNLFAPYKTNYARIRVLSDTREGPPSVTIAFRAPAAPSGPVSSLECVSIGRHALQVSWALPQEPNGILRGYRIIYQKVRGVTVESREKYTEIGDPCMTNATLTGLQPGTRYRIAVHALSVVGLGEPSVCDVTTLINGDINASVENLGGQTVRGGSLESDNQQAVKFPQYVKG